MVENRQLQTTVMLQEQGVNKVKHSLEQQWSNVSTLISQLKVMNTAVDKQRSHYHSIDNKLAGVMLDIVEINNVLADHFEARTLTHAKEGRKVIEVEAPAKVSACAISPNATKYRGRLVTDSSIPPCIHVVPQTGRRVTNSTLIFTGQ